MQITRKDFYQPLELARNVMDKVKLLKDKDESIDYLAFVPDGEPTLDINLGKEIELLRALCIKIAVITNASLIWSGDVQQDRSWLSICSEQRLCCFPDQSAAIR
jgi:wyosine [tRNA(Phe)-imidazoG37] synthetase (radical SAM superfamily)